MATRIAKSYISTDRYVLKWRKLMKITMVFLAPIAASTNIYDNIQHQKLSFTKSKTPAKCLFTKLPMPNIDFERNDVVDSNGQPFSPNIINENDIFMNWKSTGTCITHTGTIGDQFPTKRKSNDDQKSLIIQDSTPPALVTPRMKENLLTVNSTTVFKLKSELYVEFPNKCPKNENYKMTPNWWLTKSTFAAGFDVKACSDQVVRRGATSTATESYRNPTGRTWDVWIERGPWRTAEVTNLQGVKKEDTFYRATPRILRPIWVQYQRTVQQGEEVHSPGAGEVYGFAAAESIVKMSLWTWDVGIRSGDDDTSLLDALIQLKMLWAGAHLGVSH